MPLKLRFVLILFLGFFGKIPFLHALTLPPIPHHYVTDEAHLFTGPQNEKLEGILRDFEAQSSNQVLILTVPDLQDETIEEFSIRLAEKWKPGQKEKDNGVILVVAPRERKVRIEVGYGLEGVLPDALAKEILEAEVLPSFKQGNFYQGVLKGTQAILAATRGEYVPKPGAANPEERFGLVRFIVILFVLLILLRLWRRVFFYRSYGSSGGTIGPFINIGRGGRSWGGGSMGGFSSGGGGFGGGGASGSW